MKMKQIANRKSETADRADKIFFLTILLFNRPIIITIFSLRAQINKRGKAGYWMPERSRKSMA
jgi:hypothetical protein